MGNYLGSFHRRGFQVRLLVFDVSGGGGNNIVASLLVLASLLLAYSRKISIYGSDGDSNQTMQCHLTSLPLSVVCCSVPGPLVHLESISLQP